MSPDLIVELAWKSALCAGLTLGVLALMRRRSAAERSWFAHAGLLATLLLPLTVLTLPNWEVKAPAAVASAMTPAAPIEAAPIAPAAVSAAPLADQPSNGFDPEQLALWLYALPAALLGALLLIAVLRLQLLRSRAQVLVDPQWLTALAAAQRRLGFKHGTALLVSSELRSPISWGVVRPIILLDDHAAGETAQAETIIAHELAHVARLDWAKLLVGRLAIALFWFNPLVWILARTCHELCEESVDDAVLNGNIDRADYASLLVGAARHDSKGVLLAANGVAPGPTSLKRRVMRVLDPQSSRAPARTAWVSACCVGVLAVAAPLSAVSPVREFSSGLAAEPAAAAAQAPIVASAGPTEASATKTAALHHPAARLDRAVRERDEQPIVRDYGGTVVRGTVVHVNKEESPHLAPHLEEEDRGLPLLASTLVEAAEKGDRKTVDYLLRAGISPNVAVHGDGSPLIAAARSGRSDLVQHLLARGANIDGGVDGDGNPLIVAAAAGHYNIVRLLLDRGADIEAIVPSDENALMQAAYHGHEDVVRLLIARGANVNSRDGSRTPLNMARAGGDDTIVRLLLDAGARQ